MSATNDPVRKPNAKKRHRLRVLMWIVGVVIVIRIVLPYVLLHVVNGRLAHVPGYHGHIADLDLAIIRGAYQIEQFNMERVDSVSFVWLEITGRCQLECVHCYADFGPRGGTRRWRYPTGIG